MTMDRWHFDRYRPSAPREAKGGIKAPSRRGAFAASWWGKRWIAVIEGFHRVNRLQRGRAYARQGQVLSIEVEAGAIHASVQGSRRKPYQVTIGLCTLPVQAWRSLARTLADEPRYAAALLSGELPPEVENSLAAAGYALFPRRLKELDTRCSCPDQSNPCKHIAAVYYLLAGEFDRDPFLLFRLRGITREEFLEQLEAEAVGGSVEKIAEAPSRVPEPLATDPGTFWQGGPLPDDLGNQSGTPGITAALPKQLGNFPFWRGRQPLLKVLVPIYRGASRVREQEMGLKESGSRARGSARRENPT